MRTFLSIYDDYYRIFNDPTFLAIFTVVAFVALGVCIMFLLTLQNTLKAISPLNRRVSPGNVWLMLIPLFNMIYIFILVGNIADSIKAECDMLNVPTKESRPTYGLGLGYAISNIIGLIFSFAGLATLVLWIMYWVKVNEYKKIIIANRGNEMLDVEKEKFHDKTTV